jgi:hypothetical protein
MDSNDLLSFLKGKRPKYSIQYEDLIGQYANKGNSYPGYAQFGPVYQLFMYAFVLGFQNGERIPLPSASNQKKDFLELGKWQPDGLVNYLLMLLIGDENVREEADIDVEQLDELDDDELKRRFSKLITAMEEFANGGFRIIQSERDNNPDQFRDPFAFIILLKRYTDRAIPNTIKEEES